MRHGAPTSYQLLKLCTRQPPRRRFQPIHSDADEVPLEVVLHASEFKRDAYILEAFEAFAEREGLTVDLDRRIHTGGLCFLGVEVPKEKIRPLARFRSCALRAKCRDFGRCSRYCEPPALSQLNRTSPQRSPSTQAFGSECSMAGYREKPRSHLGRTVKTHGAPESQCPTSLNMATA